MLGFMAFRHLDGIQSPDHVILNEETTYIRSRILPFVSNQEAVCH